jgi:hypothetical protein
MASKGLYANINARKKAGTSRSKSESTISSKSYKNMQEGFPKKKAGGYVLSDDNKRRKKEFEGSKAVKNNMRGHKNSLKAGGMLKAVPEDKKKSLGKLPTPVRKKMGFMKEGGIVDRKSKSPQPRKISNSKKSAIARRRAEEGKPLYGDGKNYHKFKKGMASAKPKKGMSSAKPTKGLSNMSLSDVFRGAANELTKSNKGTSTPSVARDRYNDIKKKRGLKEGGMVIVDRQYLKGK